MRLDEVSYYEITREERQFCALLWHLLITDKGNLVAFFRLLAERSDDAIAVPTIDGSEELYLEFSFLRDWWHSLDRDNDAKRAWIEALLDRAGASMVSLPEDIPDLNELFIGERGGRIRDDVAYPGVWSVSQLRTISGDDHSAFRELCKSKWAHNIKPDLVILSGGPAIVIEAKLDSREGSYPSAREEKQIFDAAFGPREQRVGQLELQAFLFRMLDREHQQVIISRDGGVSTERTTPITWSEAFQACSSAIPTGFVTRLSSSPQLGPRT